MIEVNTPKLNSIFIDFMLYDVSSYNYNIKLLLTSNVNYKKWLERIFKLDKDHYERIADRFKECLWDMELKGVSKR